MGKTLIAALALLGLFFFGMAALLHSTFFHQRLLKTASQVTGWEFQIQNSAIRILRGQLELEGVLIQKPGQFTLQTEHLTLKISPVSLLSGKLVSRITLNQPHFILSALPQRRLTGPLTAQEIFDKFEGSVWLQNFIIDRLLVNEASIELPSTGILKTFFVKSLELSLAPTLLKNIEGGMELDGLEYGDKSLQHLSASVTLKRNEFSLNKFAVTTDKLQLHLQGDWKGDLAQGKLGISGGVEVPQYLLDPIEFSLVSFLKNRRLQIGSFKAKMGKATFDGVGFYDFSTQAYSLPFTVEGLDLDAIFGRMKNRVLGPSKGTAKVQGMAEGRLPNLVVHSVAEVSNLRHLILATPRATGKLDLNWPLLTYDAIFFHHDVKTGSSKGGVAFKKLAGRDHLQAFPQAIEANFDKTPLAELLPDNKITGSMSGSLKLQGADTSMKGTGSFTVTDGSLGRLKLDSLSTEVAIAPGGEANFSKSTVVLTDFSPLLWPGTLKLTTSGDNFIFAGSLSPEFSVQGSFLKVSDTLKIDRATYKSAAGTTGSNLTIQGTISPNEKVDLRGVGTIDLSRLAALPAYVREGSGPAKLDLKVVGTLRDPTLNGSVEFLGSSLSLRGFFEDLSNLRGTLHFAGKQINTNMKGSLEEGDFDLQGNSTWGNGALQTVDLHLKGERLSFSKPENYHADFDCNLSLKGKIPNPQLSGPIDIIGGRYVKKFEVHNFIIQPSGGTEESLWDRWGGTTLQLTVKSPGSFEIKNNIATITLQADLKIQGTVSKPRIEGALSMQDGTFHYLGTDFEITEGRVEFGKAESGSPESGKPESGNPSQGDPTIYFVAEENIPKLAPIPTHTVKVTAEGRLTNLKLSYASIPAESQEDIISLIAFGMTREELKNSGRSTQSLAAGVVAEEVAGVLGQPLTKATGLDIFRLESSTSDTSALSLSRVSLGRNVTDRWSVEFKTDLAPDTAERTFQTNYHLTDNILINGSRIRTAQEQKYHFGLSLRFRLD